jgi:hypothetical protein
LRYKFKVILTSLIIGLVIIIILANSNTLMASPDSKARKIIKKEITLSAETIQLNILDNVRPYNNGDVDIFGIRKLYDTKLGGFEWYMNMDNPEKDRYLYNFDKMQENDDDSYNIGGTSRLSVYSKGGVDYDEGTMDTYDFSKLAERGHWHKPSDWKNVEITGEYRYNGGDGAGITHYARSEDHSSLHDGCGGSSYKNKIYFDGTSNFNKEQSHPTSWEMPHIEHNYGDLKNNWFRFKAIVYNLPSGHVKLENWLDPYNNNNWIKIGQYVDQGGWGIDGTKCGGESDQIITWGSPMITFRWDNISLDFRNLSIREIEPAMQKMTNIS